MSRERVGIEPGQKDALPENDLSDVGSSDRMTRRDFLKLSANTVGGAAIGSVLTESVISLERMKQWNEIGASIKELRQKITSGNDGHPNIQSVRKTGEYGQTTHEISFSTNENKDYHIGGLTQADNLELVRLISGDGNLTGIKWDADGNWKGPVMMGLAGQNILTRRKFLIAGVATTLLAADSATAWLFPGKPPEGLSATATATLQGLKESENNPPRPTQDNKPTPISTPFRADVTSTIAPDGSIKITATPKPTLFPSRTSTPESSPTLTIRSRFTPKEWVPKVPENATVNREMIGKADPKNLYPLVGAVDLKHRKSLDLQFGAVRIVAVTNQDMKADSIKLDRQNAWREAISTGLEETPPSSNNASGLGHDVQGAISLVKDLKKGVKEEDIYIVLEGTKVSVDAKSKPVADTKEAKIAQVIVKVGDNYERYRYIGDNGFAELVPFAKAGERKMDHADPEKAEFSLMPRLAFNGKGEMIRTDLKDGDPEKRVSLEGVVTVSPIDSYQVWGIDKTLENIMLAKKFGANLIRINMVPSRALRDISLTKQIIETAEKEGMYVMLCPAAKSEARNTFNDLDIPDDDITKQVAELAKELKSYDNLILDTWLEIKLGRNSNYPDDQENIRRAKELYDRQTKMINEIRKVNMHAIVGVGSISSNKFFPYYYKNPITDPLVIYTINDNVNDLGGLNSSEREYYMPLINDYHRPVMFLESNYAASPTADQLNREVKWIQQSIENRKDRPFQVHVTGYQMGAGLDWPNGLIASNLKGYQLPETIAPQLRGIYFTKRGFMIALSELGYYIPSNTPVFSESGKLQITRNNILQKNIPVSFDN